MSVSILLRVHEPATGDIFSYELAKKPASVGQGPACDLKIRRDGIADLHGVFDDDGDALWYEDGGSSAGSTLNGTRMFAGERIMVQPADLLELGGVRLTVLPPDTPRPLNPPGARDPFARPPGGDPGDALDATGPLVKEDPPGPPAPVGRSAASPGDSRVSSRIKAASDAIPMLRTVEAPPDLDVSTADANQEEPAPRVALSPAPGRQLGRYQLLRLVGQGGMGTVYAAHDPDFASDVAIKILAPSLAVKPQQLERFKHEAQAARRIDHPNVVKVFERGVVDGVPFIAMELLSGETLADRIRRGRLTPTEMADTLLPVFEGVALAHQLKIIHRDLKPANIFLARQGALAIPKVLDFGVSRLGGARITQDGAVLGTMHYLAPEQAIDSAQIDERADEYALAGIMYACLTGRPPHEGANRLAIIDNITRGQIRRPRELHPDIPPDLEAVVLRGMKRDPGERYPSVYEMGLAFIEHASRAVQLNYMKFSARLGVERGSSSVPGRLPSPTMTPPGGVGPAPRPPQGAAGSPSAKGDPLIGRTLGSHRIVAKIGQGGMGAVYLAEHDLLNRAAAVKVLLPEFSTSPDAVQRFIMEARATAQLRHPAFVEVYDSGTLPDGSAYLVMEHLQGETLGALLHRRGRLAVGEALAVTRAIALGVGHAHQHGIVHRDLKPDNVFLVAPSGAVKILDFGIAKLATQDVASQTRSGSVVGTPLYMAPEQCRGSGRAPIDHRADLYALGCILHAMLAGTPPFPLEGFGEIIAAHLGEDPPRLRTIDPAVPVEVESLVLRLLAKRPADRPKDVAAVVVELDQIEATRPSIGGGLAAGGERVPSVSTSASGSTRQLYPEPAPSGTLSASAAELEVSAGLRRSRRGKVALAATALVLLMVAVGAILWTPGTSPTAEPAITTPTPHRDSSTDKPAPKSDPATTKPTVAGPTETPPTPGAAKTPVVETPEQKVSVTISSTPAGADIVDRATDRVLGTTPYRASFVATAGSVGLSVRKEGFQSRNLDVRLDHDQAISLALARRRSPVAHPDKGAHTTTKTGPDRTDNLPASAKKKVEEQPPPPPPDDWKSRGI